jgi:hypothetical protein
VVELEPLHAEANALLARISLLRTCEANYEEARQLLESGFARFFLHVWG